MCAIYPTAVKRRAIFEFPRKMTQSPAGYDLSIEIKWVRCIPIRSSEQTTPSLFLRSRFIPGGFQVVTLYDLSVARQKISTPNGEKPSPG